MFLFSALRFSPALLLSSPLSSALCIAFVAAAAAAITVAVVVLHATAALNSWRFAAIIVVVVGVGFAAHVLHW